MASILSLTLLSLGLSSVAARSGGHSIDDLKKKVKGKHGYHSSTISKGSTKHSSSSASVSCSSSSYAAAYKKSKSGFADVTAKAFINACGKKYDYKVIYKSAKAWAKAWAKATAAASASCYSHVTGSGHAEGCAFSKASADATAVALAGAWADATAKVVDKGYCHCTDVKAFSSGSASVLDVLVADVYAKAEAIACTKGNGYAYADAYIDCTAHIFASLYAKAIAKAVYVGKCYQKFAYTDIKAFVNSDVYEKTKCYGNKTTYGPAYAKVSGGATTKKIPVKRH